jgi:hypothetical protein
MVNKILTASGVRFRQTRFLTPQKGDYAVYMDDVTADGPDGINRIFTHDITVELYLLGPDNAAELAIEAALNAEGIPWTKQARYWLQEEQRYQVIYEFSYIEKRRT